MSSNSRLTGFSGGVRDPTEPLTSNFDREPAASHHPLNAPDAISHQLATQPSTTGSFSDAGRRVSEVIVANSSAEESGQLTEYSFPPDLQDPILSTRRYRIVNQLGEGSHGKVFLSWDERRQYARFCIGKRNAVMSSVLISTSTTV